MQETSSTPDSVGRRLLLRLSADVLAPLKSMPPARMKVIASIVALLVLGAAFVVISRTISGADVLAALRQARLEWVAVAVGLAAAGQAVRVVRSVRLLAWEAPAPAAMVAHTLTGAQVINWLSPIRAGDVWRIWRLNRAGANSLMWSASSVVIEKGADSLVLAGLAAALLFAPLPAGVSVPLVRLLTTVLICLLAFSAISALGSSRLRDALVARAPKLDAWVSRASEGILPRSVEGARQPWRTAELAVYSLALWALAVLTNGALALAFNLDLSPATLILLLLTLQTTTILAPVPGNIGVFPLIALTVLGAVGVAPATAIAYGTLLYVVVYGVLLVAAATTFVQATWVRPRAARPRFDYRASHAREQ